MRKDGYWSWRTDCGDVALRPLLDPSLDWSYSGTQLKTPSSELPVKCKPDGTAMEFASTRLKVDRICDTLSGAARASQWDRVEHTHRTEKETKPKQGTPEYILWLARRSGKTTDQIARELAG